MKNAAVSLVVSLIVCTTFYALTAVKREHDVEAWMNDMARQYDKEIQEQDKGFRIQNTSYFHTHFNAGKGFANIELGFSKDGTVVWRHDPEYTTNAIHQIGNNLEKLAAPIKKKDDK